MRRPRIKAEGSGYYHCMSRIIERRMILAEREKDRLVGLMRGLAAFGGLNVLSYCFMSNHFHILIHVPERQTVSDEELLRRLLYIYAAREVELIAKQQNYRLHLYVQGKQKGLDPEGHSIRQGFTREEVQTVIAARGRLPMHELLRCRVRYFSEGLAFGGQEFVEAVFRRYRGHFGPRRQCGARPMRFGEWQGLCTLRDLRLTPVLRC